MHLCSHKTHRFLKESSPTDVCAGGPNALHFTGHFKSCFFIFSSGLKSPFFFFLNLGFCCTRHLSSWILTFLQAQVWVHSSGGWVFTSQSPKREHVMWKDHPQALEEGGVKEQRPTHGWVDRHMDIPLLLAKQVKDAAEGKWKLLSCLRLFATLWTIQSMEFSRPEYWSG